MGRSKRSKGSKKTQKKKKTKAKVIVEEEEENPVVEETPEDAQEEVAETSEEAIEAEIDIQEEEEVQDQIILEDEEEDGEDINEEPKKGEDVWEAVDWNVVSTSSKSSPVFDNESVHDIIKGVMDKAWEDGVITDDEMAMLLTLKAKLNMDDDTFNEILDGAQPIPTQQLEIEEEEEDDDDDEDDDDEEEDDMEIEIEEDLPPIIGPPPEMPTDLPTPPPRPEFTEPVVEEKPPKPVPPPTPKQDDRNLITFTHSIRGNKKPLGESFDLTKKVEEQPAFKRRCPHCRAMIRVRPEEGRDTCPICGGRVVKEKKETPGLRRILDQGKSAFKEGDQAAALELYTIALAQAPDNKEAQFYLQKIQKGKSAKKPIPKGDARNVSFIQTKVDRLDQLLHGGLPGGSQVLLKGPAFCGKEVVFDKIMASTLELGIPVIYVSSNRAMKEVMHGVIKQTPEFKRFNQEGLVRMYDLFTKHTDGRILKEGHRIFNIEDREDFKRFQTDLVYLMEELVQEYHGGVMVLNSLSPLITQADQNDLMKFLQVLIARSKSYRFTNILDMAAGVHPESVENSVEYLMDGIIEFQEKDQRNSLRLKGFRHGVLSRDWVDYKHTDKDLQLVGSFQEERIL